MIIDQLPSVGTPALTDETVTEQGQNIFKITWQRLLNLFKGNTTLSELSNDAGFVNASGAAAAAPVQSVNGMTGAVTVPATPLSDSTPSPLGTVSPGTSSDASRADHVHAMPSAEQVGAMNQWELLWTNASPTSAFPAQTVSLDLSSYDFVAIVVRYGPSEDLAHQARSLTLIGVGWPTSRMICYQGGTALSVGCRAATVTTTGVAFSNGQENSIDSTTRNIPVAIYGIKGVNQ